MLVEGSLKGVFLDIYLTTFSESVISERQKLWRSAFYSKCLKLNIDFKIHEKIEKKFFVSKIIPCELVSLTCLYEEQDTFHRQPMC